MREYQVDIDTLGTDTKMALFNVDDDIARDFGVTMEMALVEPKSDNHVTLVLCNNADHPVFLEEGQLLGLLEDATLLDSELPNKPIVGALCTADSPSSHSSFQTDWYQCLLEALKLRTKLAVE